MPRKKVSKSGSASTSNSTRKGPNKSEFIRSNPGLTAKEVIQKAAAVGMHLTDKLVYNARAAVRLKAAGGGAGKKRGRPSKASKGTAAHKIPSAPKSDTHLTSDATSFINAALDIGLAKAETLLRNVRTRLSNLS
jgi:hypothetical protein